MKIEDILFEDLMIMDLQAETKTAAIEEMVNKLAEQDIIDDAEGYEKGIIADLEHSTSQDITAASPSL